MKLDTGILVKYKRSGNVYRMIRENLDLYSLNIYKTYEKNSVSNPLIKYQAKDFQALINDDYILFIANIEEQFNDWLLQK